jgi:hypothetical protein
VNRLFVGYIWVIQWIIIKWGDYCTSHENPIGNEMVYFMAFVMGI